ncbi:MAG: hypothetical protein RPU51_04510 [Candidatus Sedimenticola sp. (ex Thyasira tokunagai)]
MNALKIITTLLAALAPMMFFHGEAFYHGQLSYWELPPGLFTQSLENTLIHGFIAYSIMGIPQLAMLFTYLIVAVLVFYNIHEISKFTWTKRLVGFFLPKKKEEKDNEGNQLIQNIMIGIFATAFFTALLLAVLMSAVIVHEKAHAAGQDFAKTQHHNLPVEAPLTVIHAKKIKLEGRIISCGTLFCAVLVNEEIEVIPVNQIEAIKYDFPNKLVKDAPLGR